MVAGVGWGQRAAVCSASSSRSRVMAVRRASLAQLPCPIARSLDLVGEWWSLLIVRDALFGACHFDDFKTTGIADNILATRLRRLVDAGILNRRLYQVRPERYEYVLTQKGAELAPVVAALRQWGTRWTEGDDQTPRLLHAVCGHDVSVGVLCASCDRSVPMPEIVRSLDGVETPLDQRVIDEMSAGSPPREFLATSSITDD
jgi:DNA-binding HxlR family transcriptional regulator